MSIQSVSIPNNAFECCGKCSDDRLKNVDHTGYYATAYQHKMRFKEYNNQLEKLKNNKLTQSQSVSYLLKTHNCFESLYKQLQNIQVVSVHTKNQNFLKNYPLGQNPRDVNDVFGRLHNMTQSKAESKSVSEYRKIEANEMVETISQLLAEFSKKDLKNPSIKYLHERVTLIRDKIKHAIEDVEKKGTIECLAHCLGKTVMQKVFDKYYFSEIEKQMNSMKLY